MNEQQSIIIRIPEQKKMKDTVRLSGVVRIKPEAELSLMELCGRTGLSMCSIASQLITQAAAVCRIERGCEE